MKGAGRAVLVSGEAGIGKTRLAMELMKSAAPLKVKVLYGRSVPHDLTPYLIFADAFEELFEADTADAESAKEFRIDEAKELGIKGWILGPETSKEYREIELEPKAKRERLFESVANLLLKTSKARPVLMVLEDLHWADHSSLGLLHYLTRNIGSTHTLMVGTYRTEELSESIEGESALLDTLRLMRSEGLVEEIALDRLGALEVAKLVTAALREQPPKGLSEILYRETEGNPLFVIEALRLLIQEGQLKKTDEHWQLTAPVEKSRIPEKVHEVILRRLEKLSQAEHEILECAAAVGDEFDSHLLEDVLKIERVKLLKTLSNIEKKHHLIHYAEKQYHFDHSKIREVLYDEISPELKMQYHLQIADDLERLNAKNLQPFFSRLAYHYMKSGVSKRALHYYREAAEDAKRKYAIEETILQLNQALKLLEESTERAVILEELGDLYEMAGDLNNATEHWSQAIILLEGTKERLDSEGLARLHRKAASALQIRGEMASASAEIEGGLRALGEVETAEHGWLELVKCNIAVRLEIWDKAREHADSALKIFRRLEVPSGEAQTLLVLGKSEINSPKGDPSAAERYLKDALELSSRTSEPGFAGSVHTWLAYLLAYRVGNIEEAMKHVKAIEELPETIQDPHKRRSFLMLTGWLNLKVLGNYLAAETNFTEALLLAHKIRDIQTALVAEYALATVAFYQGRVKDARRGFDQCAVKMMAKDLQSDAVESICMAAECCLLQGDLDDFHRLILELKDPTFSRGVHTRIILVNVLQGVERLLNGDIEGSRSEFTETLRIAESDFDVEYASFAHFIYGLALRAMKEEREAVEHLDRARELLKTFGRRGISATLEARERLLTKTFATVAATN